MLTSLKVVLQQIKLMMTGTSDGVNLECKTTSSCLSELVRFKFSFSGIRANFNVTLFTCMENK